MYPSLEKFEERLEYAKKLSGHKWVEIASAVGVDRSNFSNYRKGTFLPSSDTLVRISYFLNIDPIWLAGEDVKITDAELIEIECVYQMLPKEKKASLASYAKRLLKECGRPD